MIGRGALHVGGEAQRLNEVVSSARGRRGATAFESRDARVENLDPLVQLDAGERIDRRLKIGRKSRGQLAAGLRALIQHDCGVLGQAVKVVIKTVVPTHRNFGGVQFQGRPLRAFSGANAVDRQHLGVRDQVRPEFADDLLVTRLEGHRLRGSSVVKGELPGPQLRAKIGGLAGVN